MNFKIKLLTCSFCALLAGVAACKSAGSGGGGLTLPGVRGGGGSNSSAAVISADDKPLDVMTKAMRAQLDAKSYRAHVTTSTADGMTNKMVIEYAAPDSYRMTGEGAGGGAGKGFKMEYVIVGGATYIKTPNAGWVKSPLDARAMINAFRDPKMLDELAKTADVKLVGPDTLDGAPMLVYEYTQNNPMGVKMKSTSKTWLSVADGLPRKTESEGEFNGTKTKTLVTMSDYNSDIKIESPVK
ncbi:MAG: LppX LprAFG lipoprotein [Pyrinomonadaceae bacterium]|nr:LppX LprAFG lipoprotein [Pyrinomonadaceae bacterium]